MTTNSSFIKEKDRGEDFHVALLFLWIYSAYMLIKHIKLLQALQTLDPRLSYANQMEAVFDKPKAFARVHRLNRFNRFHPSERKIAGWPRALCAPKARPVRACRAAWTP